MRLRGYAGDRGAWVVAGVCVEGVAGWLRLVGGEGGRGERQGWGCLVQGVVLCRGGLTFSLLVFVVDALGARLVGVWVGGRRVATFALDGVVCLAWDGSIVLVYNSLITVCRFCLLDD